MTSPSGALLPYDPQSVRHRNAEERHQQVRAWLRQRDIELLGLNEHQDYPSIVPARTSDDEKA